MIDATMAVRNNLSPASTAPARARTTRSRLLIVDDQPIVRRGLVSLLVREPDFEVCGEAATFTEAMQAIRDFRPQIMTVDVVLQQGSGLDLIREIATREPSVDVLVCSMHDELLYAERALRAGAKGFISKTEPTDRILTALRRVLDGHIYLSEQMTNRMLSRSLGGHRNLHSDPIESLSDRELEVFEQVGRGVTTRRIAERLHLSCKTIETYRENIKCKLNLRNAVELTQHAVQWVLEHGGNPMRPDA